MNVHKLKALEREFSCLILFRDAKFKINLTSKCGNEETSTIKKLFLNIFRKDIKIYSYWSSS